jgi:hypothetical protein
MQKSFKVPRASQRIFVHAGAEVRSVSVAGVHAGVLRDISEDGMFLYSDFKPTLGTPLRITLRSGFGDRYGSSLYCEGIVVRVEQVRPGAAPGIAVRLTHKISPSVSHVDGRQESPSLVHRMSA